ncbi:hypothetical protein B0I35DRAFT_364970, partial [Stachybotrys elegans]
WFNAAALQVASAVLRNIKDPDWRIYYQICFNFWKEAYVRYSVYLQVAKANLSFALKLKAITSRTAVAMIEELRMVGLHHEAPENAFLTAIVDYDMATKALEDSKMDVMARDFGSLTVAQPTGSLASSQDEPVLSKNWLDTVLREARES